MRRLWLPLLLLFLVIVSLLYFTNFLFGQVHTEWQHPYSRVVFIEGKNHEFVESRENGMSAFYFDELGQARLPQDRAALQKQLIPSQTTYKIDPGTTETKFPQLTVAPVTFLDPEKEVAFLRYCKGLLMARWKDSPNAKKRANAICLEIIHSLYQPRPSNTEQAKAIVDKEKNRVSCITNWYNTERAHPTQPSDQWWDNNAGVFGINPDGAPKNE